MQITVGVLGLIFGSIGHAVTQPARYRPGQASSMSELANIGSDRVDLRPYTAASNSCVPEKKGLIAYGRVPRQDFQPITFCELPSLSF